MNVPRSSNGKGCPCSSFTIAILLISWNAQAVTETVPVEMKWCNNNSYVAIDCSYATDFAAAQATTASYHSPGVWNITGCTGLGICNATYSINGVVAGIYTQWQFHQKPACPTPGAYPSIPYTYNPANNLCVREVPCAAPNIINPSNGQCEPPCPISDLPPITDPEIQAYEDNPNFSDTARLDPQMKTALDCLTSAADAMGGAPTVGSAYRPPAYNQHLIDVWEKWRNEFERNNDPYCASLKAKIHKHFQDHELLESQPPVANSRHTRGLAVDVTINLPPANIDAQAKGCGLKRPKPVKDPVHFQFP